MSWAGIASNQCVSLNNLKDAVATGVFTEKTTIPTGSKQITKAEAESYVYINTISGKTSNQLVVKSNLVSNPPSTTYYELSQCPGGVAYAFTSIVPDLGTGQRYVLPNITPIYYTYTGSSVTQSTPPSGYNSSIQKTTLTGCP
jgi:hypothetical protein